ncbi:MAG: IS5 family transposase [Gammaproteobacteria bacterium]|nr:MAG: IS5 family transposase [Gammaproteobacteria bacterium]
MIRYQSQNQLPLSGFETPFEATLDDNNRWVKLAQIIPWDALASAYYSSFHESHGRPAKDARLIIGAVIIKHKLCLSDEETIEQIRENLYYQYFVGLKMFQSKAIFAPSLFVEIRKRMGEDVFKAFEQSIIDAVIAEQAAKTDDDNDDPDSGERSPSKTSDKITHQGKLILDATVVEQSIRYPTDLGLLNEAREISEAIIDNLYPQTTLKKKPRTYRKKARKDYLAIVKRRRPGQKLYRKGNKQQLQYLRRNFKQIEAMLNSRPKQAISLSYRRLRQYWIIQALHGQQEHMYQTKTRRCNDRIVSISQPYVRPIIRGKQNKAVEFGAKLSVSLTGDGIACVDACRWDAFHEARDLKCQVEAYKTRHGHYPEKVLADPLYGTRKNREYLKDRGIHYAGKPLGRPKKVTKENKEQLKFEKKQRHEDYVQRIPIEGKFGQGKNGYGLNKIKAKTANTSFAWINSIFFVMNLLVLARVFCLPAIVGRYTRLLGSLISAGRAVWLHLDHGETESLTMANVCE